MPRAPKPWFRFYSEAVDNAKVHALPDRLVKPWLFLLCIANTNKPRGRLPSVGTLAFKLRRKASVVEEIILGLSRLGFLRLEGNVYVMNDWDEWQADRDVSVSLRHANVTPTSQESHARSEREKEQDKEGEREEEKEGEETQIARAPAIHPDLDHSDLETGSPYSAPFTLSYVKHYEQREAKPPSPLEQSAARLIERDYGEEECTAVAESFDWLKHPNYMRPILEERKNGSKRSRAGRGKSAAAESPGGLDDRVQRVEQPEPSVFSRRHRVAG